MLVTAKKDGAKIAITVVTDEKGRYSFPANRLEPGQYNLKIRATGFFADGRPTADVAAGKTATADLKLMKTDNIAPQLTNAEWLLSMPGTGLVRRRSCRIAPTAIRCSASSPARTRPNPSWT